MKLKGICVLLLLIFILQSCKKNIDGCTDSKATNFNATANKDDGTCQYKGEVTFWKDDTDHLGDITVTMQDSTKGTITVDETKTPECGAVSCFTYTANPGIYSYRATDAQGHQWNGSVTITSGGCTMQQITPTLILTLDLTQPKYAALLSIGGSVVINSIIIFRAIDNNFYALSANCTYDENQLQYITSYNQLVDEYGCGSKFNIDGTVAFGPASINLVAYKTQLSGNLLRIYQ